MSHVALMFFGYALGILVPSPAIDLVPIQYAAAILGVQTSTHTTPDVIFPVSDLFAESSSRIAVRLVDLETATDGPERDFSRSPPTSQPRKVIRMWKDLLNGESSSGKGGVNEIEEVESGRLGVAYMEFRNWLELKLAEEIGPNIVQATEAAADELIKLTAGDNDLALAAKAARATVVEEAVALEAKAAAARAKAAAAEAKEAAEVTAAAEAASRDEAAKEEASAAQATAEAAEAKAAADAAAKDATAATFAAAEEATAAAEKAVEAAEAKETAQAAAAEALAAEAAAKAEKDRTSVV
jgi:hypothetical protein